MKFFEQLYGPDYTTSIILTHKTYVPCTIEKKKRCYSVNIFHPASFADKRSVKFLQQLYVGSQMPGVRILSQLHLARKYLAGVDVTLAAGPLFLAATAAPFARTPTVKPARGRPF